MSKPYEPQYDYKRPKIAEIPCKEGSDYSLIIRARRYFIPNATGRGRGAFVYNYPIFLKSRSAVKKDNVATKASLLDGLDIKITQDLASSELARDGTFLVASPDGNSASLHTELEKMPVDLESWGLDVADDLADKLKSAITAHQRSHSAKPERGGR